MRKFIRTQSPPGERPARASYTNGYAPGGSRSVSPSDRLATPPPAPPWEDPEFPAGWRALGSPTHALSHAWMRPHELSARPTFLGVDEEEGDGEESVRWTARGRGGGGAAVCGAVAALAGAAPRLLAHVLPAAYRVDSARPYTFRLWVFGEWREVSVDDRLPVARGHVVAGSLLTHDFTLPLLVKAYAKLSGSYEAMSRDSLGDALRALTGGCVQAVRPAPHLAAAAAPLATLAVALSPAGTHLLLPPTPTHPHLLHLRSTAPHPLIHDHRVTSEEFCSRFTSLVLVHVPPAEWSLEPALRARRPWRCVVARRAWRRGVTAGGAPGTCRNTADCNPQFQVEVPHGVACHVVVSLVQRARGAGRGRQVGLAVYAVPAGTGGRAPLRSMRALEAARGDARELAAWFRLAGGRYAVVPHTRTPHVDAEFLLRVLADDRVAVWEANEDNAVPRPLHAELAELAAAGVGRGAAADPAVRWAPGACGALLAARDVALAGAVGAGEATRLAALATRWREAWGGARRRSALRLRALLAPVGVSVSNKVLEALVARFARDATVSREDYVHALATLYLAHERYRQFEAKSKSCPVSLEEVSSPQQPPYSTHHPYITSSILVQP